MAEAQMMDTEGMVAYDDDMMDAEEYQGEDYDIELVDEVDENVDVDIKVTDVDANDTADNDQNMVYDFQSPLPSGGLDGFKNIDPTVSATFSIATQQTELETITFGQDQTAHFSSDFLGSSILPTEAHHEEGQFADAAGELPSELVGNVEQATETQVISETHVEHHIQEEFHVQDEHHTEEDHHAQEKHRGQEEATTTEGIANQETTDGENTAADDNRSRLTSTTLDNDGYQPAENTENEENIDPQQSGPSQAQDIQGEQELLPAEEDDNTNTDAGNASTRNQQIAPIVCYFEENEVCLYPKDFYNSRDDTFSFDGRPYPPDYLLPDLTSYDKNFDAIFSGLRELLEIGEDDELRLVIEELGLTFSEDNRFAHDFTLADVHRLYTRLATDEDETMIITLQTEPRITKRYSELLEAAGRGKKLEDVSPHSWSHEQSPVAENENENEEQEQEDHLSAQGSHHSLSESPEEVMGENYAEEFEQGLLPAEEEGVDDDEEDVLLEESREEYTRTEEYAEISTEDHAGHVGEEEPSEEQGQLYGEFLDDKEDAAGDDEAGENAVYEVVDYHETNTSFSADTETIATTTVQQTIVEGTTAYGNVKNSYEDEQTELQHAHIEETVESEAHEYETGNPDDAEHESTPKQQQQADEEEWNELLPVNDDNDEEANTDIGEYPQDRYHDYPYDGEDGAGDEATTNEHHDGASDFVENSTHQEDQDANADADADEYGLLPEEEEEYTGELAADEDHQHQDVTEHQEADPNALENYEDDHYSINDAPANHEEYAEGHYDQFDESTDQIAEPSGETSESFQIITEQHLEHAEVIEDTPADDANGHYSGLNAIGSRSNLAQSLTGDSKRGREDDFLDDEAQNAKRRKSTAPEDIPAV